MATQKFTDSGIEIKPVYAPPNGDSAYSAPGEFPFTRGVQPDMYRGRLWTMRQYAGFSTAEESNKRYHYLLNNGVSGLSVAFDLPTQIGYDSDHELSEGEVGKVGVAIDSIDDMEVLFNGITLEEVSTSMTINATGFILLAFYVALAKKQGADLTKLTGTIQNDILKEYAARGTYIYPPKPSMRIITDIFEWCATELPKWNTISISGYHIRAQKILMDSTTLWLSVTIALILAGFLAYLFYQQRQAAQQETTTLADGSTRSLQLQAYERLTLLVDRIALPNLISRVNQVGVSARDMQLLLTRSVKEEFDHNITQQIYVSSDAWRAVKNLKEQNMLTVNQLASALPPNATGLDLNKLLLEFLMTDKKGQLHEVVSEVLSYEAKKLL
jgi:hypothetical protein